MAITRARTSSVAQGPSTRKTLLGGNDVILGGSYDAIGTVTVGSGGQSTITFSSIPSTYKHLQIRGLILSSSPNNDIVARFNSDTGANYALHNLYGANSSVVAYSDTNITYASLGFTGDADNGPSVFITDLLDYSSTAKFKTTRSLNGNVKNATTRYINLMSGLWRSTNAINSITITHGAAVNFNQYSQFSLYGVK
jgi:hypothetical protein